MLQMIQLVQDLTITPRRILERYFKKRLARVSILAVRRNHFRNNDIINPEFKPVRINNRTVRILKNRLETNTELTYCITISLTRIPDTDNGIDMPRNDRCVIIIRDCKLNLAVMLEI